MYINRDRCFCFEVTDIGYSFCTIGCFYLKSRLPYSFIAVAATIAIMFGGSVVSPAFAHTLKTIPILGSIFKLIGDKGLEKAEKAGFSTKSNESITVGDSTLTITDYIYYGSRLSLAFIVTNYEKEPPLYKATFRIDQMDFYGGAGSQGEFINDTDYSGVFSLIIPNELNKDSFKLSISINEFNGKKGSWNLKIPVTKIEGDSFLVTKEAVSKDYKIIMKKVTFTPATTEINFDLSDPVNAEEINQIIRFR